MDLELWISQAKHEAPRGNNKKEDIDEYNFTFLCTRCDAPMENAVQCNCRGAGKIFHETPPGAFAFRRDWQLRTPPSKTTKRKPSFEIRQDKNYEVTA